MRHAISRTVDGIAVLVAIASIGLWVRSYHAADRFGWAVEPRGPAFNTIISRSVETTPGRIVIREHTAFM
jgi:hypothetical protein